MLIYNILCQPPSSSTSEDYSAAPSASLTIHDLLICHIVLKARLLFTPLIMSCHLKWADEMQEVSIKQEQEIILPTTECADGMGQLGTTNNEPAQLLPPFQNE